jgi:hypothetical protein
MEIQVDFQEVTDLLHTTLFSDNDKLKIDNPVFMPAGRSFFANLESNIFSFLISNVSIDYFIKDFGSDYQFVKKIYQYAGQFNPDHYKKIKEIIENILDGIYIQHKGEDYISIRKDKRRIYLSNASSGQQEFLPMSLILSVIPYVLTAFNNLIQAGNTRKAIQKRKNPQNDFKKLYALVPKEQILDIEDIGAYMLEDGKVKTIIDSENQIIDAQIIDEVSNQIFDTFQELIDLETEE